MLARLLLSIVVATAPLASLSAQEAARGFIVGQVIDKESGRPLEAVNLIIVGTELRARTDLDGRYRIATPVGLHSVRAFRLGSIPAQVDSLRVTTGGTVTANLALATAVLQLQSVAVTAGPVKASSEDALLAMQKAAPRVSDGISAEAIKRSPGSNAGDAIVRVTGVSIVDNKFAVVRGLGERYSNTLLNGVDLPSPEPTKKIVPLDLFPSSLIESIVVSKTATPDRPGDFAGGSVEVTTKEFPDERVLEASFSTGWGSQSTFRKLSHATSRGVDWFGFDEGGRHQMPSNLPSQADASVPFSPQSEQFAERIRNVWTPAPTTVAPNFSLAANLGGRAGGDEAPFGYALSTTLSRQVDAATDRLSQLIFDKTTGIPDQGFVSNDATTSVDLGAIANFALRLGTTQKLGWKNLYTRNSEEQFATRTGYETYNGNVERLIYQASYVTRSLLQTQLTGEHLLHPLFDSRLEWKASLAISSRDEPENRSLIYFRSPTESEFRLQQSKPSAFWFRFLDDRVRSMQVDWSFPLGFLADGAQFKTGGLYRERDRQFTGWFFRATVSSDPLLSGYLTLAPEQAFSPEVLGTAIDLQRSSIFTLPYESDDDLRAAYAMVDIPITPWLRLVGGARNEDWKLNLYNGTRLVPILDPSRRKTSDLLGSLNLTVSLSDRQNLRIAGYQTVARPDPREVSPDRFEPIAGDCGVTGNPALRRARVLNGDVRWEFFPDPGELVSLSVFFKDFTDAIGEVIAFTGSSSCDVNLVNFASAQVGGGEVEFRKALTFLPGPLANLGVGLNLTMVRSGASVRIDSVTSLRYQLQGQSDRLLNANLLYSDYDRGFDFSVLVNYFSDRIFRYGVAEGDGEGGIIQTPSVIERGRASLDAKLRQRVGTATVSLSARNLTDSEVIFFQAWDAGVTRTGYLRPGISVSLGVAYALH